MIGFNKSAAIGFIIGYFIVGIGFFPVERSGAFEHFIWIIVGLIGAIIIGFISGVIKFINLRKNKYNIKTKVNEVNKVNEEYKESEEWVPTEYEIE